MSETKVKCLKCGREMKVGDGVINLSCQPCGGTDMMFNFPALVYPMAITGEFGERVMIRANEQFSSAHKHGFIWKVEVLNQDFFGKKSDALVKEESTIPEKKTEVVDNEKEERERKEKEEGGNKEKEKKEPMILKATRRIRGKLGDINK